MKWNIVTLLILKGVSNTIFSIFLLYNRQIGVGDSGLDESKITDNDVSEYEKNARYIVKLCSYRIMHDRIFIFETNMLA